jgi:uncharacterized protein
MQIDQKWDCVTSRLREMGHALIAYSGGVDSSLLLRAAADALGPRCLAVTSVSETSPSGELERAREFARLVGVRHRVLRTNELRIDEFVRNAPDRCYHCKKELFTNLRNIAAAEGIPYVLDGSNADDQHDYRPGRKAAAEFSVRSPLAEAGLSKAEIRELARKLDLPVWDKPALACLSSRIPYGTRITPELLGTIQAAEDCVRRFGFGQVRVRHCGDTARIEVSSGDFGHLLSEDVRRQLAASLRHLGYVYVCIDLQGYRAGSLNESLKSQESSGPRDPEGPAS